jgi:hypothetical protein
MVKEITRIFPFTCIQCRMRKQHFYMGVVQNECILTSHEIYAYVLREMGVLCIECRMQYANHIRRTVPHFKFPSKI